MTTLTGLHPGPSEESRSNGLLNTPAPAVMAGCAVGALLTFPKALQVLQTGVFLNPDDAMRAVEVRDFLNGQAWFDLIPHRLSPDHAFLMHWSRLLDLPLAVAIRLFEPVLPTEASAELAMRLTIPAVLFVLSLATMVGLVRRLIGPAAMLPAALLLAGSAEFVGNFIPGTIHHHAIQACLLLGATKLLVDAFDANRPEIPSAAAGALAALSLGIGLQNLPFVVGLATLAALAWVVAGEAQSRMLRGFGAGVACTAAIVFVLDVPPSRYAQGVCDAFSAAHLIALLCCGVAFVISSLLSTSRLGTRLIVAICSGAGTLGLVAATYPACLHDPMSAVDPLLRAKWLSDVGEALPLMRLLAREPWAGIALFVTQLIGLAATAAAAWHEQKSRKGWLALLLLSCVGVAGTFWQVRVAASTGAFMVPGVTWMVLSIFTRLSRNPRTPALLVATVAGLIGNGLGVQGAAAAIERNWPATSSGSGARAAVNPARCFEPDAFRGLAALSPGLVLSTIDPGSAILAYTSHTVLAAPYHRNTYGNRIALLAFDMTPDKARPLIEESGTRYIAICGASNETAESARLHPEGLGAMLLEGRAPAWLSALSQAGDLYRIYRVEGSTDQD